MQKFNGHAIAILAVLATAFITACAPQIPVQVPVHTPAQTRLQDSLLPTDFPTAYYQLAAAHGKKVLQVDATHSVVVIEVHKGGSLARLGHDHVVASHNVTGYVSIDDGRADLYVPLESLIVDEPDRRTEAGFDTQPSAEAIAGTRHNMLGKVLETARYPFALIRITRAAVEQSTLNVSITLHGITRAVEIPATTETIGDGIAVSGRMSINQSDFGIVPFSVMGGAMQVQDRLDLRFRIVANEKLDSPLVK